MQDYQRETISAIVENLNKTHFLPDIQRNFVWKPEQVYSLFDSLMRDYPISTFLFWIVNGEYLKNNDIKKLEFVKKSIDERNKENKEIKSEKEYSLVLDGQQRLTTFYLVLKGNYIIRNKKYDLYYNILSNENEQENDCVYEFKFFNESNGENFIEKFKNKKYEDKIWYRVKNIFDFKDLEDIPDEIRNNIYKKMNVKLTKDQIKNVSRLYRILHYEKIIYFYPEKEKDYDKALNIFVRTNYGGIKLTHSDWLFSKMKANWHLARDEFDNLVDKLNDGGRYNFDNDVILKSSLVLFSKDMEGVKYKAKNFKSSFINEVKNNWKNINDSITLTKDLLNDKLFLTHGKTISSYNALIPIMYWIYKKKKKGFGEEKININSKDIGIIRTWLIKAFLSGVFGGQSDTILYKCKEAIDKNLHQSSFPAKYIENIVNTDTKKDFMIDAQSLDKIKYNSKNSYLLLSLLYKNNVNFIPAMEGNLPEQDHIISKNELNNAGISSEEINSIYNIRLVGRSENRAKSKKLYSNWLKNINKEEIKKHLIPSGIWNGKNYNTFLIKRKKILLGNLEY